MNENAKNYLLTGQETKTKVVEDVDFWLSEMEESEKLHKKWWDDKEKYIRAYNNDYAFGNTTKGYSENYCKTIVDSYCQHTDFIDPTVSLPPVKGLDMIYVHASATLINEAAKEAHLEEKFAEAKMNMEITGCGWLRIGYHAEILDQTELDKLSLDIARKENETMLATGKMPDPIAGQDHAGHNVIHDALLEPDMQAQLMAKHGPIAPLIVAIHKAKHNDLEQKAHRKGRPDFTIEPQSVFVESIDPRNMLGDWRAKDIDHARWIATICYRPLDDLKNDKALSNTLSIKGPSTPKQRRAVKPGQDNNEGKIKCYDIWDRKLEKRYIITPNSSEFLFKDDSPYEDIPGFFPFVQIVVPTSIKFDIKEEPSRFYGESTLTPMYPSQIELNTLADVALEISKESITSYAYRDTLDPETVQKLAVNIPGSYIPIKGLSPNEPITNAIAPINKVGNSAGTLQHMDRLRQTIQRLSGLSYMQLELGQDQARTATASQLLANASSAPIRTRVNILKQKFLHANEIIRALIKQFYTAQRVIQLTGDEGVEMMAATGSQLIGGTSFGKLELATGIGGPDIQQAEFQKFVFIYNLAMQTPYAKKRELFKRLLEKSGEGRSPNYTFSDSEWQEMMRQEAAQAAAAQPSANQPPALPGTTPIAAQSLPQVNPPTPPTA